MSILQKYMNIKLNKDFVKIHDESFVYHNFLSTNEIKEILNEIKNNEKENKEIYIKNLKKYEKRLKKLFTGQKIYFQEMTKVEARGLNSGDLIHIDIPNHMNQFLNMLVFNKLKGKKIKIGAMAFIIYFNEDYEGGEISYPEYSIDYKPKAGDLVVHYSEVPHGVTVVKSGTRYTHPNFIQCNFYVDKKLFKTYVPSKDPKNPKLIENFSHFNKESTNKRMQSLQKNYKEPIGKYKI
jgi:hypothetical protein